MPPTWKIFIFAQSIFLAIVMMAIPYLYKQNRNRIEDIEALRPRVIKIVAPGKKSAKELKKIAKQTRNRIRAQTGEGSPSKTPTPRGPSVTVRPGPGSSPGNIGNGSETPGGSQIPQITFPAIPSPPNAPSDVCIDDPLLPACITLPNGARDTLGGLGVSLPSLKSLLLTKEGSNGSDTGADRRGDPRGKKANRG